jgi:hypothetical protein
VPDASPAVDTSIAPVVISKEDQQGEAEMTNHIEHLDTNPFAANSGGEQRLVQEDTAIDKSQFVSHVSYTPPAGSSMSPGHPGRPVSTQRRIEEEPVALPIDPVVAVEIEDLSEQHLQHLSVNNDQIAGHKSPLLAPESTLIEGRRSIRFQEPVSHSNSFHGDRPPVAATNPYYTNTDPIISDSKILAGFQPEKQETYAIPPSSTSAVPSLSKKSSSSNPFGEDEEDTSATSSAVPMKGTIAVPVTTYSSSVPLKGGTIATPLTKSSSSSNPFGEDDEEEQENEGESKSIRPSAIKPPVTQTTVVSTANSKFTPRSPFISLTGTATPPQPPPPPAFKRPIQGGMQPSRNPVLNETSSASRYHQAHHDQPVPVYKRPSPLLQGSQNNSPAVLPSAGIARIPSNNTMNRPLPPPAVVAPQASGIVPPAGPVKQPSSMLLALRAEKAQQNPVQHSTSPLVPPPDSYSQPIHVPSTPIQLSEELKRYH